MASSTTARELCCLRVLAFQPAQPYWEQWSLSEGLDISDSGAGIRAMQIRLSSEITAVNNPQRHYLSKGEAQAARLNIQSAVVIYVSFTMIDGKG